MDFRLHSMYSTIGKSESLSRRMNESLNSKKYTRRNILGLGLAAFVCSAARPVLAAVPMVRDAKFLAFHNLHTDERLAVQYSRNGRYIPDAHEKINHLLRDHYSGDVYPINGHLLDLLYDIQAHTDHHGPIEVISGYRSPKTNMRLASYSDGVAKNSYHTKGMAIDIRLPGVSLSRLHNIALHMKRGGVGYYPTSDFVHVDVGPVRRW